MTRYLLLAVFLFVSFPTFHSEEVISPRISSRYNSVWVSTDNKQKEKNPDRIVYRDEIKPEWDKFKPNKISKVQSTFPNNPDLWPDLYPGCRGTQQSPINIVTSELRTITTPNPLSWNNYSKRPRTMTAENTGHSIQVTAQFDRPIPSISRGPLSTDYTFQQLHFHWGRNSSRGSEHTVNRRRFPMEMHVVHYKTSAGSFENSLRDSTGLAVVAFMFQVGSQRNKAVDNILQGMARSSGRTTSITPFALEQIAPPFSRRYATYQGSLTTPECNEVVTWLLASDSLTISESQLNTFRRLLTKEDGTPMENYRPVQNLNGRTVYYVED